jgi:hypothetical protein
MAEVKDLRQLVIATKFRMATAEGMGVATPALIGTGLPIVVAATHTKGVVVIDPMEAVVAEATDKMMAGIIENNKIEALIKEIGVPILEVLMSIIRETLRETLVLIDKMIDRDRERLIDSTITNNGIFLHKHNLFLMKMTTTRIKMIDHSI